MNGCFLGIDTSAYTTSLALVDAEGQALQDLRQLLEVGKSKRGLRQSEALFLHQKNLPLLFAQVDHNYFTGVKGIGVSSRPRPLAGSYMPVFLAGLAVARILSATHRWPLYEISHQEGHVMAGLHFYHPLYREKKAFLAVHFSGGTSEILHITPGQDSFFHIETLGRSLDLQVGQLVDRIGVAMGLDFPAGQQLELLAREADQTEADYFIPAAVKGMNFSFSGAEAGALRMLHEGKAKAEIAWTVLQVIAKTLEKVLLKAAEQTGQSDVLLVGGVMANQIVKDRLCYRLEHPAVGLKLYFAEPHLSSDNSVGVARLAAASVLD